MNNLFDAFEEKKISNLWAITGGDGQTDGEESSDGGRGDSRG